MYSLCRICPKKCIQMQPDEEGFLYPVVDKSRCVECNACNMVCPIQSPVTEEEKQQKAYLVQHCDEKVRLIVRQVVRLQL